MKILKVLRYEASSLLLTFLECFKVVAELKESLAKISKAAAAKAATGANGGQPVQHSTTSSPKSDSQLEEGEVR